MLDFGRVSIIQQMKRNTKSGAGLPAPMQSSHFMRRSVFTETEIYQIAGMLRHGRKP